MSRRKRVERYLDAERQFLRSLFGNLSDETRKRLGYDHPADHPHVQYLLDLVPWMNARLRRLVQVGPERFANNLREVHSPSSTAPVPAYTLLAFRPPGGQPIDLPRGFPVHPAGHRGVPFRTCGPVKVRPINVTAAAAGRPGTWSDRPRGAGEFETLVRFTLTADHPDGLAGAGDLTQLRLHLTGESGDPLPFELYEGLFADLGGAWVKNPRRGDWFPAEFTAGGFGDDEHLLGDGRAEFPGERRVRDFFAFPRKFLTADLHGLAPAAKAGGNTLEVVVALRRWRPGLLRIQPGHLTTNAVPAVNLREVSLPPAEATAAARWVDVSRALDTPTAGAEVYAVTGVMADTGDGPKAVPHWLPGRVATGPSGNGLRWHAERFPADRTVPGGRVAVRLLDPADRPADLTRRTLHITAEITNGLLSEEVRGVRQFRGDADTAVRAVAVCRPTTVLRPRLDNAGGWQGITLLTLNSLALGGGSSGGRTLADGLRPFALLDADADAADSDEQDRKRFAAALLGGLTTADVSSDEAWDDGWVRGRHYKLNLAHAPNLPGSGFVFGSVLKSLLTDTATFDSFVRVGVTTPTAAFTWPAVIGEG